MSFVTHAQNKDATAFKSLVEEALASKVVMVLDALKAEVASRLFGEEGGVSGGVSSVKKKPAPPGAGTVELPGQNAKGGSVEHAGRSNKASDIKLPGKGVSEGKISNEPNQPELKVKKVVQQDKKPHLSSKAKADRKGFNESSFNEELLDLNQRLEEAHIKPGTEDHMAHHVHMVHTGDHGMVGSRGHTETNYYHIHHTGVELGTDSKGNAADTHVYHVVPKTGNGVVHKFHVQASSKTPGSHHVTHMGTM
jgi:hypothetical protein